MASPQPPTPPPISQAWPIINGEKWADRDFTRKKAYVCAIFAELAYWHIPSFELEQNDRIKVVPSSAYQALATNARGDDIFERMRERMDMPTSVIARNYAVVVVARLPQVIFVAIRGTAALYDWAINTDLRRATREWPHGPVNGRFHRGFYAAIDEFFVAIRAKLDEYGKQFGDVPVYVTGHSLGGAMAAIFHAVHGACEVCGKCDHDYGTHSSYTFGMPRYADRPIVRRRPAPHHTIKSDDIVPRVPPLWLGYANSRFEYGVDGTVINRDEWLETLPTVRWAYRLATARAVTQHFMEGYRIALA